MKTNSDIPDINLLKKYYPTKEEFIRLQNDEEYRHKEIDNIKTIYDFLIKLDSIMWAKQSEESRLRLVKFNEEYRMI